MEAAKKSAPPAMSADGALKLSEERELDRILSPKQVEEVFQPLMGQDRAALPGQDPEA